MNIQSFWQITIKMQQKATRLQEKNPGAVSNQKRKMTRISLILELLTFFPQVAKSHIIFSGARQRGDQMHFKYFFS